MKLQIGLTALDALALSSFASANYLVTPVSTNIATGDDSGVLVNVSGFTFYGQSLTTIGAITNGNLNVGNANTTQPDISTGMIISPLGDDLVVDASASLTMDTTPEYYAFTWSNPYNYGDSVARHSFQAVLFRQDATIHQIAFRANDIVFGYESLGRSFRSDDAFVGIAMNSLASTTLPGSTSQGLITRAQADSLLPTGDEYLLFRRDASGMNYSVTRTSQNAVPEPASVDALGLGALAMIRRRRVRS